MAACLSKTLRHPAFSDEQAAIAMAEYYFDLSTGVIGGAFWWVSLEVEGIWRKNCSYSDPPRKDATKIFFFGFFFEGVASRI